MTRKPADRIDDLIRRGQVDDALSAARRAARAKPKDPHALDALARSYTAADDFPKSFATYDRLAKLLPKHPKPLADKAHLFQLMGRMDEAEALLRRAISLAPDDADLFRMLSATARLTLDDPIVGHFRTLWDNGLDVPAKISTGFALGKALGAEGWPYIHDANAAHFEAYPWDAETARQEVASLQSAFGGGIAPVAPTPRPRRPVFVVGMPRSGTTLVEQILACHPQVSACGETGLGLRAAYSVVQKDGKVREASTLTEDDIRMIGDRYHQGIAQLHRPKTEVFTDKSMQMHLVLGLLHAAMPEARLIILRRDPRDIGLSIYRNAFKPGTHRYAADLRSIAVVAGHFDEMIGFWQRLYPQAALEISYEALVTEPEPMTRAILDHVGLPWNPGCLHPERSDGLIHTLSVDQARGPISRASIGGWQAHASELAPLLEALEDGGHGS